MNKYISYIKQQKQIAIILAIIVAFILLIIGIFFWYQSYVQNENDKKLEKLSYIFDDNNLDISHCKEVFAYDKSNIINIWGIFTEENFEKIHKTCENQYIYNENTRLDEYSCENFINQSDEYFEDRYIEINNLQEKREYCYNTFFKVKFLEWKLYNVDNNFKSEIIIDFGTQHFYRDIWQPESEEFLSNRIVAKKRFIRLLETSQNIQVNLENLVLYPQKAILELNLEPNQTYSFNIKDFDIPENKLPKQRALYSWEANISKKTPFVTHREDFIITMPENKYLGMMIKNPVTLYQDTQAPKFQLLEYNSDKTETKVKICRIENESYAKIEVFSARNDSDFFTNGIDKINTFECFTKNIKINNQKNINLAKIDFDFNDVLWTPARSGLYYLVFENKEDRISNKVAHPPIFFGIVDSHITMKLSKNWEAFFFVNDFSGKPLANQNIRLYVNNYQDKSRKYNRTTREYDETFYSPFENPVLWEAEILWKTNEEWILQVDLSDKIWDLYDRTFKDWWEEQENGKYKSIFITSASDTHISYVNSRWNAWIAPWNFGYQVQSNYWYGSNEKWWIKAQRYLNSQPEYYSHTYPDRTLYLPWEEVNIKSIIRNSNDLSIPKNQQIEIKVTDSKRKVIHSEFLNISEYGSISTKLELLKETALGAYFIEISIDEIIIWRSGFTVEVFKNPKFKNDISLETTGLNEWFIDIKDIEEKTQYWWTRKTYKWKFQIQADVVSQYYNWAMVSDANYSYKVYKQHYYWNDYWDDCYYGCYWEPRKEFYTQWKWILDENGMWKFAVDVEFSSDYSDYKYIVEVSVIDWAWDNISWSNSTVVMLPEKYKRYNWDSKLIFEEQTKFVKQWQKVKIIGWINVWKWSESYNNSAIMIVKKKDYLVEYIEDIRWKKPKNRVKETIVDMFYINDSKFKKNNAGKLELDYTLAESWEYIFEYANLWASYSLERKFRDTNPDTLKNINKNNNISSDTFIKIVNEFISQKEENIIFTHENKKIDISLEDIFSGIKNFISVVSYGNNTAKNPIKDDNKIHILSEKVSYKLWETARVLIRLPFENAKILWTIEKQGVLSHEYEDITWNISFKEFEVDDTFVPNAYISAVVIDTREGIIPEYKVGYTEIVVDKTEKKTDISIQTDKKKYAPRETVKLDISVQDINKKTLQSELTVMVVDDSLISLLWNVDLNTLEKFYKKLPFQIQTQITSIAMLQNYYFSRAGIVWWSGNASFKWWDSAISSRNKFKNTAFYDANIITDKNGKAHVEFELPDNLTNFRVMVVSNSKENYFWYSQDFIEVRKNVLIEDKTPLMLRTRDDIQIWANIFNMSDTDQEFEVIFEAEWVEIKNKSQKISIASWKKEFVTWDIINISNPENIKYSITAKWSSAYFSDKIEKEIPVFASPVLITSHRKSGIIQSNWVYNEQFILWENVDIENSNLEIIFSNNRLFGIEKTVQSLLKYPYGCIEQSISSTYPNAVLKKFNNLLSWVVEAKQIEINLSAGIQRISSMQTSDWGFGYWIWDTQSDLTITPYVLRSLLEMRAMWVEVDEKMIQKAIKYLQKNAKNTLWNTQKVELFWALALANKPIQIEINESTLSRHDLLAYTYGLYYVDKEKNNSKIKKNIEMILEKLKTDKEHSYYWNSMTDKAILAQLMIDIDYDVIKIDEIITDLYDTDFSSYYYSTKTKNAAFTAFAKYIEKVWSKKDNTFDYTLADKKSWVLNFKQKKQSLWLIKKEYKLIDVLEWNTINLNVRNVSWDAMYVDFVLHETPLDKEKILEMKNGMSVERTISKVLQEEKISECRYSYWNNSKENCEGIFKKVEKTFEKGQLYKTEIVVKIDWNKKYTDLVIEDYLPSGFEIVQSKFKTESIAVGQSLKNQWNWNHIENRPNVAMAHAKHLYENEIRYEYYVRPKFSWTFTQPPVTAYFMYNPEIRAHTKFNKIEVK